jgi:hypothetical protein
VAALGCSDGRRNGNGNGDNGGGDGGTPPNGSSLPPTMQIVITGGAPSNAPGQFGGPNDLSDSPSLVYPPDGVLMPPNIGKLEVQFQPAANTNLFEISFTTANLELDVYTGCVAVGTGCGYQPDAPTWALLEQYGRGTTVTIALKATGPDGHVGAAAPRTLSFTDEDLQGGIYYWAAATGTVFRYDFGLLTQVAESFYTPAQSGSMCVGCHVLSRDGSRIAVGMNVPGPANLRLLDVASKATLFESDSNLMGGGGGSNFEALAPDGSRVLVNQGNDLAMLDAASGMALGATLPSANMPDWSADGAKVVFARPGMSVPCFGGICPVQPGVDGASLFLVGVTGNSFGAPTSLVGGAGGENDYYPSVSPDGAWVAFNRSAQNSYDAPDARVMVVSTGSSPTPLDLTAVNGTLGNSWPKFAPFVQHFNGATIFWLTFSSRRDYGLRLVQSGKTKDSQVAQVWMVAFSPDGGSEAQSGFPPFWLPFQDLSTGNHIAQWTQKVDRMPCTPGPDPGCGPGEQCMNGECVPTPIQ